jgi:hypothetical protein
MLGLITSSSFFVPQINLPGSMASFVLPAIPIHAIRRPLADGEPSLERESLGDPCVRVGLGSPDVSAWIQNPD